MEIDRRALLISLASSAAMLALPEGAAGAFEPECFAAARKDDRGVYSAALFSLKDGDMRSVELPDRPIDIRIPEGASGSLRAEVIWRGDPDAWLCLVRYQPNRHFGHGAFGRCDAYSTENDYDSGV
jgi:hypothetical protein